MSSRYTLLKHGQLNANFLGHRKRWYLISAVVLVICIVGLFVRGLDLGIEFRGGADFQATTPVTAETADEFRQAVLDTGVPDLESITVTTIGDSTVRVQTRSLDVDEVAIVRAAIADQANITSDEVTYNLIGASWGAQITQQAIIALIVFIVIVILVIAIYFRDWKTSVAAMAGVFHDLIVTVGVYALVGFTVTPATLIGVLTILGYSLYDTMVVFDKVRENVKGITGKRTTYTQEANLALNQVVVRSINTTVIGILPVLALLFAGVFVVGSGPLKDLSLAMAVGMAVGAYSSIFIASSLLVEMKEREPAMVEHRRRLRLRAERVGVRPQADSAIDTADEPGESSIATVVEDAHPHEDEWVEQAAQLGGDRQQPRRLPRSKRKK